MKVKYYYKENGEKKHLTRCYGNSNGLDKRIDSIIRVIEERGFEFVKYEVEEL